MALRLWKALIRSTLLVGAVLLCLGDGALAQTSVKSRYALVIGNSAYQHATKLENPTYDAKAVGDSLERLGFKVTKAENLAFDAMRRAILQFGRDAKGSDIAVVYFAGHGIEFGGEDWLIPVDADLQTDLDVDSAAINLKSLMKTVSDTQNLGLVILDACRTNPFQPRPPENHADASPSRGMDAPVVGSDRGLAPLEPLNKGLAPVEPANNVLVAFAARDGTVAQDGDGKHSPFTSALLSHIETQGLEINFLFRNIRDDVLAATKNRQEPFIYGSLSKDFIYLNPPLTHQTEGPPIGGDEIAWAFLKGSNDLDSLRRFIATFPRSTHYDDAQARINTIVNPKLDWAALLNAPGGAGRIYGSAQPVALAPETSPDDLARKFTHDSAAVDTAWEVIKAAKDTKTVEQFVNAFPTAQRKAAVKPKVHRSVVQAAAPRRGIEVAGLQASLAADVPWAGTRGVQPDSGANPLVDAFSQDYEVREDRRARACDRLAADPEDTNRTPGAAGAAFDRMDGGAAFSACRAAVAAFPDVARYRFQLCRALSKLGRSRDAAQQCSAAVETSAGARPSANAYYVMTFENINNIQSLGAGVGAGVGAGPAILLPVGPRRGQFGRGPAPGIAPGGPSIQNRINPLGVGPKGLRAGPPAMAMRPGGLGPRAGAVPELRQASRRFGAAARALRQGAQIARTANRPVIAQTLAVQAGAARMMARRTAMAVRAAIRPPSIRVAMPQAGMMRIRAPQVAMPKIRIVAPKIPIMIPHILFHRP